MNSGTKSGRLLILDDETMVADTVAIMARNLNFETSIALTARDFLKRMKDFDPTHAIIDLSMPDIDGLQVMKMMDTPCSARIIIVSGNGNRILEAARRVGFAHDLDIIGILQKPFRSAQLKALLSAPFPARPPKIHEQKSSQPAQRIFTRDELSDALNQDEFTIYLQPKVRCIDNRIVGFEALARWNHPTHGLVMPGEFIDLFTEYDLELVWMRKLIRLAVSYIEFRLPAHVHLSLNMSMSELSKATTPLLLSSAKRELGIAADRFVIELVENGIFEATADDIEMFARLRLEGFQLSIDDFGSGFSSLRRLSQIPFSELKIDRSFVQEACTSSEARKLIGCIVAIGHSLEMSVTVEGAEDLDTLEVVKSLGCDNVQGFIYSRPVPIEQVMPWIDAGGYLKPGLLH